MPSSAMAKTSFRTAFRESFAKRMKMMREHRGLSQADMAALLQMSTDAYKKAEKRGALPIDLLLPFADAVREDILYVLTGRRKKNNDPEQPDNK